MSKVVDCFMNTIKSDQLKNCIFSKNATALMLLNESHDGYMGHNTSPILDFLITMIDGKDENKIEDKEFYGKSVKLYEAYKYLMKKETLDIYTIKQCHSILMENIDDNPGEFREINLFGNDWIFIHYDNIPTSMKNFEKEAHSLIEKCNDKNMVLIATYLSAYFLGIHPFENGNWTISRLIINYVLKKGGFPFDITFGLNNKKSRRLYHESVENYIAYGESVDFFYLTLLSMYTSIENYLQFSRKTLELPIMRSESFKNFIVNKL